MQPEAGAELDVVATVGDRRPELKTELEEVRAHVDSLISHEGIDKPTALGVLKLLHTMETMLLRAQFEADRTIESLKSELTVSKLTHKQADMLETLSGDLANARQRLSCLESVLAAPPPPAKRRG